MDSNRKLEIQDLAQALQDALQDWRTDDAEKALDRLLEICGLPPDDQDLLTARVSIMIQRNQAKDAILMLNGLGSEKAPELKAVCLRMLNDPFWEGLAADVAQHTTNPQTRLAMQALLTQAA